MAEPVVRGNFLKVEVSRVKKLKNPKGACYGFADVIVHGMKIRNCAVFLNKKENIYFVKPPQQRSASGKYYDLVTFGKASGDVSEAVLKAFEF